MSRERAWPAQRDMARGVVARVQQDAAQRSMTVNTYVGDALKTFWMMQESERRMLEAARPTVRTESLIDADLPDMTDVHRPAAIRRYRAD
jgi:hypothetical protein